MERLSTRYVSDDAAVESKGADAGKWFAVDAEKADEDAVGEGRAYGTDVLLRDLWAPGLPETTDSKVSDEIESLP